MPDDLTAGVVRILDSAGTTVGTGFVVTEDAPVLVVTCAHVVEATSAGPGERVRLAFQAGDAPVEAEVLADGWHPDQDVAFLRLATRLPDSVAPVTLGPGGGADGHTFRSFGYPQVGDFQGVWAEGRILGQVTDERGALMLQLRAQEIAPGMSGAPVLDVSADRVVGMVTMTYQPDATLKFRDAAFAIPAETLRDLCPGELELLPTLKKPKGLPIRVSFQAPPLPAHFVPRPEVSDTLRTQMDRPQSFTTLVGLGGIGKTCLAVAMAQELESAGRFPDGIFWLDGRQHTNLGTLLVTLGGLLDLDLSQRVISEQQQAVNYMLRGKEALVILDNFESVVESLTVIDFLRGLACNVLITSRVRLPEFKDPLVLTALTGDTALELFAAVSGNELFIHHPDADALCNHDLEGHPLAIEMMAALTATGLNPTELRQYLRESPLDVLGVDGDLFEMKSVVRALSMSFQRLRPTAQAVLIRASVFPTDFDLAGLASLIPDQPRLTLAKAIQELEARSLLQSTGPALYRLHAVTRQYAYGLLDERPVYHRRAAQYFLTEGDDSLAAVSQLLQAGDRYEAAILVPEHIEDWIHAGRASEALATLRDFAPDEITPVTRVIVYEAQGDLQYLLGEFDEAVSRYKEATESVVQVDMVALVRLHRKLAEVLSRKGEYDDALACLARGRDLLIDVDSATDESARLAVGYGTVLLALGRYDDAILEAQTTLERLSETSPNPRIVADLHDLIGKARFFKGEFAKSLDEFQSALRLRESCSDQQGVIKSYSNLAVVYGEQNRYGEALQANEAALEIAEKMHDTVALAALYANMAADCAHQKAYEQAIKFNKHSLALCNHMGNMRVLARVHHNLGDLYRRTERFDLAAEHLTRAIEVADQVDDQDGVIDGVAELAEVYLAQGRVEEALVRCLESLHLAERTGNQYWRPASLHLLGRIYHAMHEWDDARTAFEEADRTLREREAWLDLSDTLLSWAKLEQDAGQVSQARELGAEAATLAEKCEANDLMKQASALLVELESAIRLKEGSG